jgi:hypothetical protein
VSMTAILDNFAVKVDLTAMGQARDAEFEGMLDEFRAAGEMHVYEGSFAGAWEGYGPFYDLIWKMKAGGYPKPEIVPMDSYFIETALEQYGGHIGYKVRYHLHAEIAEWQRRPSGSRFKGSLPSVSRGHCLRATPPMLHRPG